MEDIIKLDLYEIIGTNISATEAEIKKAYRKKALSCHPDKNPDNPKAAELFLQLSKALEILTDSAARAAYDKVIKAKLESKKRITQLDAKRRKFKEDLEAREEAFKTKSSSNYCSKTDEQRLQAEIERLKKEGSKQVQEEQEYLRQKILEQLQNKNVNKGYCEAACRVKIKWKVSPDDTDNGGYNHDNLHRFLSKHGEISVLVISAAKKGRALVEFKTSEAAESAVKYEIGLMNNPLKLEGLSGPSLQKTHGQSSSNVSYSKTSANLFPSARGYENSVKPQQGLSFSSAPDIFLSQPQVNDIDFEKAVLSNLKRAEERKKLIEELQAEDEGT